MARVETNPAGFVKLPRADLQSEWSRKPYCLALFAHILARANREAKEWNGITITRGQFVTSRRRLVEITGIPEQSLRTALNTLTREGVTQYQTHKLTHAREQGATNELTHGYTIISICKFDNYEGYNPEGNPRSNPREEDEATHEATHKPTTTKEDIRKISAPSFILDLLCEWADYRKEIRKPLATRQALEIEARKLLDYSDGNPEKARRVVDEAISNGWQGLFPIRNTQGSQATATGPLKKTKKIIRGEDNY